MQKFCMSICFFPNCHLFCFHSSVFWKQQNRKQVTTSYNKWQQKFRVFEFIISLVLILVSFLKISQTFHVCGPRIYAGLRGFWLGILSRCRRFLCFVREILSKFNKNQYIIIWFLKITLEIQYIPIWLLISILKINII